MTFEQWKLINGEELTALAAHLGCTVSKLIVDLLDDALDTWKADHASDRAQCDACKIWKWATGDGPYPKEVGTE